MSWSFTQEAHAEMPQSAWSMNSWRCCPSVPRSQIVCALIFFKLCLHTTRVSKKRFQCVHEFGPLRRWQIHLPILAGSRRPCRWKPKRTGLDWCKHGTHWATSWLLKRMNLWLMTLTRKCHCNCFRGRRACDMFSGWTMAQCQYMKNCLEKSNRFAGWASIFFSANKMFQYRQSFLQSWKMATREEPRTDSSLTPEHRMIAFWSFIIFTSTSDETKMIMIMNHRTLFCLGLSSSSLLMAVRRSAAIAGP